MTKKTTKSPSGDVEKAKVMARQVIEYHFGAPPKRITYQAEGLSNIVFLIHHAEGEFVVRIGQTPGKINAYFKEQWAVNKAREAGIPTVEILEVGNEVIPAPFMVARYAKGQAATQHPERLAILREMGRYAALINAIPTDGFGSVFDWSKNQLSRNETWAEFLFQELQLEARLGILKKYKMLPPRKLKILAQGLEKAAGRTAKPRLNHGDVRLKNVLVDAKGKIIALIDWEDCMSNLAPQWELSLALHDLSIDEKQEFLRGYGISDEKFAELAPLLKALNIINYAPHIEAAGEAEDVALLDSFRLRLSGALDLYSL
jgi:aminoglycoside phosphotransferase (APT) family kinase protein